MKFADPFDLWSTPILGRLKLSWYEGKLWVKHVLALAYLADWIFPCTIRKWLGVPAYEYAHVEAMLQFTDQKRSDSEFLDYVSEVRVDFGWGLPFSWYSKNGIYPAGTPFITNTPYVMEALVDIVSRSTGDSRARNLFDETWMFLEKLRVQYFDASNLALSYAPVDEDYTVVNANSYAAFAYALHSKYSSDENRRQLAFTKCAKIVNWVRNQQNADGSWYYISERGDWDMIDCFHSCIVLKNLLKVAKLQPSLSRPLRDCIDRGWAFVRSNLFDRDSGLCRRFFLVNRVDVFRYDIYDQAEYLGLLVDFGLFDEALELQDRIEETFRVETDWFARVDILNRRWGKGFMRWGIVPYMQQAARLRLQLNCR